MLTEISLENIIRRCGDFGRYQLIHYIFLNLITIGSGILGFYYVFGVAEPSFRCRLPSFLWPDDDQFEFINTTHQFLVDTYLSSTSQCNDINGSICTHFVYDRSVFGRTITEDANFVCSHAIKRTWLSTVYQIGACSALFTGSISDKIGRRNMIRVLTSGMFIVGGLTQLPLQFINMSVNVKFAVLLVNQFMMSMDAYNLVFLLLMELTSSTHTSFAGNLALINFTVGEIIVTAFAYVARDWLNLKWLITAYLALTLPYLYFVPESPYWLFNKKKYDELEVCLRKIATVNGRSDSQWLPNYIQLIQDPRIALRSTKQAKRTNKQKILRFLPRLSIISLIAFVPTILYFKISYGLGAMNETVSPYWNIIIGAAVESIGYVTASILLTTRLGRKYVLIIYALLTSICVLVIPFIMESQHTLTTVISQMGKFAVSGTLSASWIYVPELFPTSMRGFANAVFLFVSRLGAILAPIVDVELGNKYMKITFYVYAALTLVMIGSVHPLPETRNRSFNDEEEDNDDHLSQTQGDPKEAYERTTTTPIRSNRVDVT